MRHRNSGRKLARTASHRRALFANLANALIEHERITTTEAKAKELRRYAEKLVTLGKRAQARKASAHSLRQNAFAMLRNPGAVDRLFGPLAERFSARPGGYTRIYKLGPRNGDAAPMAIIEFVDRSTEKAAS